jgi:uncharacterized membrane protein YkgB
MSKEIDDLFEINTEQESNLSKSKEISFVKHFFIHFGVFIFLIALGSILAAQSNGYGSIGVVLIFAILIIVLFLVIVVEAFVFQVKNNYLLRNSCLLLLLIYLIAIAIVVRLLGW